MNIEPADHPTSDVTRLLSRREVEVLRLIAKYFTNREIAEMLVIAGPTVESHVHHILAKLKVRHRRQAARRAKRISPVSPLHVAAQKYTWSTYSPFASAPSGCSMLGVQKSNSV